MRERPVTDWLRMKSELLQLEATWPPTSIWPLIMGSQLMPCVSALATS